MKKNKGEALQHYNDSRNAKMPTSDFQSLGVLLLLRGSLQLKLFKIFCCLLSYYVFSSSVNSGVEASIKDRSLRWKQPSRLRPRQPINLMLDVKDLGPYIGGESVVEPTVSYDDTWFLSDDLQTRASAKVEASWVPQDLRTNKMRESIFKVKRIEGQCSRTIQRRQDDNIVLKHHGSRPIASFPAAFDLTARTIWEPQKMKRPIIEFSTVTEEENKLSIGSSFEFFSEGKLANIRSIYQRKVWKNIQVPHVSIRHSIFGTSRKDFTKAPIQLGRQAGTISQQLSHHFLTSKKQTTEMTMALQNEQAVAAITIQRDHACGNAPFKELPSSACKIQWSLMQRVGQNHFVAPIRKFDNQMELEWCYVINNNKSLNLSRHSMLPSGINTSESNESLPGSVLSVTEKYVSTKWRQAKHDFTIHWKDGPWMARLYIPYCTATNPYKVDNDLPNFNFPIEIEGMRVELRRRTAF